MALWAMISAPKQSRQVCDVAVDNSATCDRLVDNRRAFAACYPRQRLECTTSCSNMDMTAISGLHRGCCALHHFWSSPWTYSRLHFFHCHVGSALPNILWLSRLVIWGCAWLQCWQFDLDVWFFWCCLILWNVVKIHVLGLELLFSIRSLWSQLGFRKAFFAVESSIKGTGICTFWEQSARDVSSCFVLQVKKSFGQVRLQRAWVNYHQCMRSGTLGSF